jgi:hypothetical protein
MSEMLILDILTGQRQKLKEPLQTYTSVQEMLDGQRMMGGGGQLWLLGRSESHLQIAALYLERPWVDELPQWTTEAIHELQ